ncbi:MAG: Rrf2 family transcriptional regulator [Eubacteriaceae bacterium]|jgi:Rrf2 family protein|nr:Rrf2 family transcriptional regulator [Eubacteriaceae bacterium]
MTGEFIIAIHALVFLNHRKEILSSERLAENICTNSARVRKVMSQLKKAGLVKSKEGAVGGYYFDGDPDQINLAMISKAVADKPIAKVWRSGNQKDLCLLAISMSTIVDNLVEELNVLCEKRYEEITVGDISRDIFERKVQH